MTTRTEAEKLNSWYLGLVLIGYTPDEARAEIEAVRNEIIAGETPAEKIYEKMTPLPIERVLDAACKAEWENPSPAG